MRDPSGVTSACNCAPLLCVLLGLCVSVRSLYLGCVWCSAVCVVHRGDALEILKAILGYEGFSGVCNRDGEHFFSCISSSSKVP